MTTHQRGPDELQDPHTANTISRRHFMAGMAALGVTAAGKPLREQPGSGNYVVFIVVDACRPSYLSLTALPHLNALMKRGVVYDQAWVGAMEGITPAVHATLGTGTLPRENGFVGFGWVQPTTRKEVDFRTLLAEGKIDPVLRALPIPSIAARLRRYGADGVTIAASGHKDYAVVGMGGGAAEYELYGKFHEGKFLPASMHTAPALTSAERRLLTIKSPVPIGGEDAWAFQYLLSVVRKVRPRLLMLNLPEVDTWGHWYGPGDGALFRKLMLNIDRGIGAIRATYQQLGILDRTNFIITADHAMMESVPVHQWTDTVRAAAAAEQSAVSRVDGTTGAIWLRDPATAEAVAHRLVAMRPPHVNAIFHRSSVEPAYSYIQTSPAEWLAGPGTQAALQHLVDTTAGKHGPDLWAIFKENFTAAPRNVEGKWKGTHGGATWQAQHIPLILSGPGVRHGIHSRFPARSVDVAPTIERLLGLPPVARPGVVLADGLIDPLPGETGVQALIEPGLQADVRGLQEQSAADGVLILQHGLPITPPHIEQPPRGTSADMPTCD